MRVARGKVVGNTVVLEGNVVPGPLAEGTEVTVYFDEEGWDLDEASWRKLGEAREAVKRGQFVTDEQLTADLDGLD